MLHHGCRTSAARSTLTKQTRIMALRQNSTSVLPGSSKRARLTLPRLPVPRLRETVSRYLTSLEPIMLEDERNNGPSFEAAYAKRAKWADEFLFGIGEVLQERLHALERASPDNWLDDNFWTDQAYLSWRAPLLANSNWWLAFVDDSQIPKEDVQKGAQKSGITRWQVRRAAWMVYRVLEYKEKIEREEIHPLTTRTGIWMHETTAKLFNVARVPEPECDILSVPPSSDDPFRHDIYVMIHNWTYSVTVYEDGTLLPPQVIDARMRGAVSDAEGRLQAGEKAVPIGVLSADQRDRWAENLGRLYSISSVNQNTHHAINHSLLGVSLDDKTNFIQPASSSSEAAQQAILDAHLHAIRSTTHNVANRIFDKPITLVVDPMVQAGAMGEHAVVDALSPSVVAEYAIVEGIAPSVFSDDAVEAVEGWARLNWVTDENVEKVCREAQDRADKIIHDSDDSMLWFEDYGANWIKTMGFSADAYVQMALQLAWYMTSGEFTATYETALTRFFNKGRTETIRTLTKESRAWVLSMLDPSCDVGARVGNLKKAVNRHVRLTREAATGKGIDRHLLGLKMVLRPLNGEYAALLDDEMFERSSRWKLSTSGLSAGHYFRGTGFGAMYEDGYGINYLIALNMIKFGIESKHSSPLTSTTKFKHAIAKSLTDMSDLFIVEGQRQEDVRSKL